MNFENEFNTAKSLEHHDFSNDKVYFTKCILLARYWMTIGKSDEEIKNNIFERVHQVYNEYSDIISEINTNKIIEAAKMKGILTQKTIRFSKAELDYIHSLNNLSLEKITFIMCCAYKLEDYGKFTFKNRELLNMACIPWNTNTCLNLLNLSYTKELFDCRPYKVSLEYFPIGKLKTLYNPDDTFMEISDFKNLVYYYLEYIGYKKYFRCERCGCIDIRHSNRNKYCDDCAREIHNEQIKSIMKLRRQE